MMLRTNRLVLRRFTPDDGPALHSYLSQERAVRYEPYGVHDAQQSAQAAAERSADEAFWAVCLADGDLVGNLYLAPNGPPQWRTWELGYVFHPDHWGQGLATESCYGLLDHVFTSLAAHRVIARCNPDNTRSWALLERLGFRREGHHRAAASFTTDAEGQPVWHDGLQYAVLDTEWRSRGR